MPFRSCERLLFCDTGSVFFWDNCETMHVVTDPGRLTSIEILHHPIALNGIGVVSASLTHKGQLQFYPPGVAKGYYSATSLI